jgi:hypothetical protein
VSAAMEAAGLVKRSGKTIALDGLDPGSRIGLRDAVRDLAARHRRAADPAVP